MNERKYYINNKTIPVKYHIIFWLGYFTFNVIRWGSYFDDYWYSLRSNLVEFPLHMILVYVNVYYLIPRFLLPKKTKRYILLLILLFALHYMVRTGLNYLLVTENIWPEAEGYQQAFTFNHIVAVVLGEVYVMALATAIKLTVDWVNQKQRIEKLRKEHLKTELNFLKAQIQPHFYFNTLNNLYALTLDKSEEAPDVVLKLSDIMQYVIYDVKSNRVALEKEINYIKNYIALEKIRHGKEIDITLEVEGDISKIKVPPLLILSYIENIFKHGIKGNPNFFAKINFVRQKNSTLKFVVENSFVKEDSASKKKGIGNTNSKRRLELLYRDNFTLKIAKKEPVYKVELEIPLTKVNEN